MGKTDFYRGSGGKISRLLLSSLALLMFMVAPALSAEPKDEYRVLLLYPAFDVRLWDLDFNSGFMDRIHRETEQDVYISIEYLKTELIPDKLSLEDVLAELETINETNRPDVIVSLFPSVQEIISAHGEEIFPGVPDIFVPVIPSRIERRSNIPGLHQIVSSSEDALIKTLEDISLLIPEIENLYVISGVSSDDLYYLELFRRLIREMKPAYRVNELVGYSLAELEKNIRDLPVNSVILYLLFDRDRYQNPYKVRSIFPKLSDIADAPIFSFYDSIFGQGILGGELTSAGEYGRRTAETVLALLRDEAPPASIISGSVKSQWDWRQLKRWNISEQSLPAGSSVLFRTESFFDRYKIQILLAVIFLILETTSLLLLFNNLVEKRRTEKLLRKSEELLLRNERIAKLGGWEFDLKTDKLTCTAEMGNIMGITADGICSIDKMSEYLHPDDKSVFMENIRRISGDGKTFEHEYRVITGDGRALWVNGRCEAVIKDGRVSVISGTFLDISAKKNYELRLESSLLQKEILLKEVHHRVKNNLAIINSLLSIQGDMTGNEVAREILSSSRGRINAMALIHEHIFIAENIEKVVFGDYVKRLVDDILFIQPNRERISVNYDIDEKNLDIDYLMPLGIIINEIISNLIRQFSAGSLMIRLKSCFDNQSGIYSLSIISETDVPADYDWFGPAGGIEYTLVESLIEQIEGRADRSSPGSVGISFSPGNPAG